MWKPWTLKEDIKLEGVGRVESLVGDAGGDVPGGYLLGGLVEAEEEWR